MSSKPEVPENFVDRVPPHHACANCDKGDCVPHHGRFGQTIEQRSEEIRGLIKDCLKEGRTSAWVLEAAKGLMAEHLELTGVEWDAADRVVAALAIEPEPKFMHVDIETNFSRSALQVAIDSLRGQGIPIDTVHDAVLIESMDPDVLKKLNECFTENTPPLPPIPSMVTISPRWKSEK